MLRWPGRVGAVSGAEAGRGSPVDPLVVSGEDDDDVGLEVAGDLVGDGDEVMRIPARVGGVVDPDSRKLDSGSGDGWSIQKPAKLSGQRVTFGVGIPVGSRAAEDEDLFAGCGDFGIGRQRLLFGRVPRVGNHTAADDQFGTRLGQVTMRTDKQPRGVVVFVHGLGTNAQVWELPGIGGLATAVWRLGYLVYTVDMQGAGDSWREGIFADRPDDSTVRLWSRHVELVLGQLAARHPALPLVGVGHGIGGTALYHALGSGFDGLSGLVAIGAPLDFGRATRAFDLLLTMPDRLGLPAVAWRQLAGVQLAPQFATRRGFEGLLLSEHLPDDVRRAFYRSVSSHMSRSLLRSIREQSSGREVATRNALVDALGKSKLPPILMLTAPSDGTAPPWQCDPAGLGLRRSEFERRYVTQSNGDSMEYNHLDLLLHPRARRDV